MAAFARFMPCPGSMSGPVREVPESPEALGPPFPRLMSPHGREQASERTAQIESSLFPRRINAVVYQSVPENVPIAAEWNFLSRPNIIIGRA